MASKIPDEAPPSATAEAEEEEENLDLRLKKKRARRVSFADTEITSVHFFRRDDDYETPPDSKPLSSRSADHAAEPQPDNEVLGFFGDLGGDGYDSGGDDGSVDGRKSFLRPMGSPSPGSSSAGSATSNDEDNFFGPVSASFIRPGRLSDSAASDEIHEETLDTTAFSMHYRSLARSDSGELKTPTAVRLVFEDKTATKDPNPTDSGSSMTLTEPKRLSSQSPVFLKRVRGGENSDDDMSIVGESSKGYDYGALSPTLDALLAEGSKDLTKIGSEFLRSDQNGMNYMDSINGKDSELGNLDTNENLVEAASISHSKLSEPNGGSRDQTSVDYPSMRNSGVTAGASNHQIQSPSKLISGSNQFVEDDSSAYHHSNESSVRQNSPRVGRNDTDQYSNKQQRSLWEGSPTSLSARRQQSILNTPSSARSSDIMSPSSKQADIHNEQIKHGEGILSVEKSSSQFKFPDTSHPGSSIKQGTDKLKQRLLKNSSISSPFSSVLEENIKELQSKYGSAPIACLEEQLFTADTKSGEDVSLDSLEIDRVETPRNISKLGQNKEIIGLAKDGQPVNSSWMDFLSKDRPDKIITPTKVMQKALTSEGSSKKRLFTSGIDLSLLNDKEVSFPHRNTESEILRYIQSPRDKASLNFQLKSHEKNLQTGKNTLLSTSFISGTTAEAPTRKSPSIKESTQSPIRRVPTHSPALETPSQETEWKELAEIPFGKSPIERRLPTGSPLLKELTPRSLISVPTQSSSAKESLQSPRLKDLIWSPSGYKATQSPSRKEPTESASRQNQARATHGGNMHSFPGKDMASTRSDSSRPVSDGHQQGHVSQSPFFTKDVETSLEPKKRSFGVLEDGKPFNKSPRTQEGSDVHNSGNYDSELMYSHSNKVLSEAEKLEGDRTQKHWLDVWVTFSSDAEQLLSPSINKLNLKAMGTLEDILINLLKVKKYEILSSEILSQKASDHVSVRHNKRLAETRLLLYKIAYEKAKLQLMGAKHDKLLKRVQLVNSGIQECEMLKLNHSLQSKSGRRDPEHDDSHLQSCTVNLEGEHQVASDTVSTMKQEVEDLDKKINSLSNFLHRYCRLKLGEPSCANTLALVQDDLKKRKCCWLLCQELQLWKIHSFENQSGLYNVVLNYQDYLSQRFTLNVGPVSSIVISNQLNDVNIVKMFPNMDVHVAFAFVLNAEVTKRCVDSNCLAQETQVTQSILCNLLDVIGEVQMAQIEIGNLIQTNFHSQSGQQLNLQLCFISFQTGIKVTLTLDVTCLKSGVYSLEILPYQVQSPPAMAQKSNSLLGEIRSAVENLEVGYSRILGLCRCVSEVLQASST